MPPGQAEQPTRCAGGSGAGRSRRADCSCRRPATGQGNIGRRQRRRCPISYRALAGPAEDGKASHRRPRSRQSRPSPADRRRQEPNPAAQRPFSQAQSPCLTARGLVDLPGTSHKALLPLPYQFAACRMPKPRRPAYEGMSQQARRRSHADQNQPWSLNATRTSGCHVPYRRFRVLDRCADCPG